MKHNVNNDISKDSPTYISIILFCSRLRDREKARDWSTLNKSFPVSNTHRRWSAESYKGAKYASSRKPPSPQYLPKLDNRPASADSSYDQNLKHGHLKVIPPVPYGQQHGKFAR